MIFQRRRQFTHDPVGGDLGLDPGRGQHRLVVVGDRFLCRQHTGVEPPVLVAEDAHDRRVARRIPERIGRPGRCGDDVHAAGFRPVEHGLAIDLRDGHLVSSHANGALVQFDVSTVDADAGSIIQFNAVRFNIHRLVFIRFQGDRHCRQYQQQKQGGANPAGPLRQVV